MGAASLGAISSPATLFVLALLLGVLVPSINFWALLLLFLSGPLGTLYTRVILRREAHRTGD